MEKKPVKFKLKDETAVIKSEGDKEEKADVSHGIHKRKQRRPRKFSKVASEIKRLQHTTNLLIRKASFARLVRQILCNRHPQGLQFRWQRAAVECLQEASEAYLVHFFGDVNILAHHAKRVTVMPIDMYVLKKIRGPDT